jgi:hypothetical protein
MTPPHGYSRDGDDVVLRMSVDDFDNLLITLGTAAGAAMRDADRLRARAIFALVNLINEGNPGFRPYDLPDLFGGGPR